MKKYFIILCLIFSFSKAYAGGEAAVAAEIAKALKEAEEMQILIENAKKNIEYLEKMSKSLEDGSFLKTKAHDSWNYLQKEAKKLNKHYEELEKETKTLKEHMDSCVGTNSCTPEEKEEMFSKKLKLTQKEKEASKAFNQLTANATDEVEKSSKNLDDLKSKLQVVEGQVQAQQVHAQIDMEIAKQLQTLTTILINAEKARVAKEQKEADEKARIEAENKALLRNTYKFSEPKEWKVK